MRVVLVLTLFKGCLMFDINFLSWCQHMSCVLQLFIIVVGNCCPSLWNVRAVGSTVHPCSVETHCWLATVVSSACFPSSCLWRGKLLYFIICSLTVARMTTQKEVHDLVLIWITSQTLFKYICSISLIS